MNTFFAVYSVLPFLSSHQHQLNSVAEGVLVAKKDFNLPKHNEIDTKNLYVSM